MIFLSGCTQYYPNAKLPIENTSKRFADELSIKIKLIGPIDDSIFNDYSKFKNVIKKINELIIITNENIQTEIPEVGSSISDFERFNEVKIVLKYSPLIDPYNQLYESAKKLPSENTTDYDQFYSDLGRFSLEICVLESQMSYKIAYRTTGEIAYNFKLYKFTPYIGNEGYRILLSEIHWSLRGRIENQTSGIINYFINKTF